MIKAITFDLDDTLWDVWPVVERAEELLHDWLAARYPRIPERFTPLELRELSSEVIAARPDMAYDRTWLRKEALWLAARRAGYAEFDVEGAFGVFFVARNAVEPFAEVRPTLERLARRYTLASLSNGNADLRLIGLDDLFASRSTLSTSARPSRNRRCSRKRAAGWRRGPTRSSMSATIRNTTCGAPPTPDSAPCG